MSIQPVIIKYLKYKNIKNIKNIKKNKKNCFFSLEIIKLINFIINLYMLLTVQIWTIQMNHNEVSPFLGQYML